jgi:hypothetical protein
MLSSVMLVLFVAAILLLIALVVYIIAKGGSPPFWIPIAISIIALSVSLISSFKAELFPSNIELIGGDVLLVELDPLSKQPVIPFAFSLGFLNRGYGEDIVEWVAVRAMNRDDGTVRLLTPLLEIDFQKFLQGRRVLRPEYMLGPFAPFAMQSKSSVTKTILFDQELNNAKYKVTNWTPGNYQFQIFVKLASAPSSKPALTVEHRLTEQILNNYFSGTGSHLSDRNFDL